MKKALLFLLKLGLTLACLGWAFAHFDFKDSVFARPGAVHYGWLAAGVGLAGLTVLFTALRWRLFLAAQEIDPGTGKAVELTLIGNLFNLVSIGSVGGDAARILLLIRKYPERKLAVTMSVMVDHLAGMVALATMFFVISATRFDELANQSAIGKHVIRFAWFYLGGGLAMVVLFFVAACPPVHRLMHGNGREWKWDVMRRIPLTYDVYRRKWPYALAGVAVSFVMLFVFFLSFWCGLRAVGGTASPGTVITAMPVIDSLCSLPISVSGVGVREKLFEILMHDLADVKPETAVAASLAGFACNVFWALPGVWLFLRRKDRVTVAELERMDRSESGDA